MICQTENENDVTVRFTVFVNLRNAVISLPIRKHFRSFPKRDETKSEPFMIISFVPRLHSFRATFGIFIRHSALFNRGNCVLCGERRNQNEMEMDRKIAYCH